MNRLTIWNTAACVVALRLVPATLALSDAHQGPIDATELGIFYPGTGAVIGSLVTELPAAADDLDDPADPGSSRRRGCGVDLALLERLNPGGGDRVAFDLFDDARYEAVFEQLEPQGRDWYVWKGRLAERPLSRFILVRCNEVVYATIRDPESRRVFQIRWRGGPVGIVRELSNNIQIGCDASRLVDDAGGGAADDEGRVACTVSGCSTTQVTPGLDGDQGFTLDVLVAYTPEAKNEEGGASAMNALISSSIADMNDRLENSGSVLRARLVWTAEMTGYTEDGSSELSRLRCPGDGYLDAVHALRDTHRADVVHLIVKNIDDNCGLGCVTAGVAYRPTSFDNLCNPAYSAFGITDNNYADSGTFAHEVGHNLGLCHDHDTGCDTPILSGAWGYCFYAGWGYHTTMAYDCWDGFGSQISYYSTPNITYVGQPIGQTNYADAVSAIEQTRSMVCNYREGDHIRYVADWMPLNGNGSQLLPYNSVRNGTLGVASGGRVIIDPGVYNETSAPLSSRCILETAGGSVQLR